MDYSATGFEVQRADEGCVFDVGSLYAQLETLTDKRKARGKRYPLALVLVLVILAKLAGEDTPYAIAQWARLRQAQLIEALGVSRPWLPSHNTYRRVLGSAVEVSELEAVVGAFLTSSPGSGRSVLVALDGKTLRGSIPDGHTQGIHLLAAYLPEEGIVLMQIAVECRENEISVAPEVLKSLDLRGKVVRGDALLTQRRLSAQIVDAGGDYVWIVKDNQPQLRQDIEQLFQPEVCAPGFSPTPKDFQTAQTVNKAHGRLEVRTLTSSSLLQDYADWPHLAQVFKLDRQVTLLKTGSQRSQTVYGITSLAAHQADPAGLIQIVRAYWGIENGLHYRRDKTLNEDAQRISSPTLAQATATLNNLVLGLVLKQGYRNLAAARRFYNARLHHALSLLLRAPT